ncbi:putative odorant-binding protein A10 [Zootermopsis nevadensis]|uniref:Ejaculatory bulb-specific protein 3 n=1 Tax=Zootermopsis nevadensis TaxID=136037 RepID=A0A067RPJ1_ZOONE|nr:putative odorant-binding protein A10 [Zootermopsis nevadensis]KDR22550.1 Ejaculatory bulb-specific protein 3 [Zootermopsis nevadensis]
MNKRLITVAIFCVVLNLISAQRAPVFGSGDISHLLQNNAVIQQQINCVLDRGPCNELGRMLKLALPEVVGRNCRSCTAQQAANARRLVNFIRQRHPDVYSAVVARYSG